MSSSAVGSTDRTTGAAQENKRQAARLTLLIKSSGYLVSTISVILLGIVSWKSASKEPLLSACLIAGMTASAIGMFLRWLSYDIEARRKANGQE